MTLKKSLRIQSVRANIRLVEDFLLELNDQMQFDDAILNRIMVSVTEAVNNGIIHGNKLDPGKIVELSCTCTQDLARFGIRDQGGGFSPDTLPDPLADANLLKEGGRGILIIRALMDTVEFIRHADGMELLLSIGLHPEHSSSQKAAQ